MLFSDEASLFILALLLMSAIMFLHEVNQRTAMFLRWQVYYVLLPLCFILTVTFLLWVLLPYTTGVLVLAIAGRYLALLYTIGGILFVLQCLMFSVIERRRLNENLKGGI